MCRSFVGILRYSNCENRAQSVAFDSSSLPGSIAVNYSYRPHFSDVELRTISTRGTSTFHAIALFEWENSGLISCLYFIKSALFIFETGISHQRSDICGSLTFMSLCSTFFCMVGLLATVKAPLHGRDYDIGSLLPRSRVIWHKIALSSINNTALTIYNEQYNSWYSETWLFCMTMVVLITEHIFKTSYKVIILIKIILNLY